jgi:hypothetical protein
MLGFALNCRVNVAAPFEPQPKIAATTQGRIAGMSVFLKLHMCRDAILLGALFLNAWMLDRLTDPALFLTASH